jgi:hypothetical protein
LNAYIRIFNSSFPLQKAIIRKNSTNNKWINKGKKISCKNKRKLYLAYRQNTNGEIKRHYLFYNRILANVIREAETMYYNKKIQNQVIKAKLHGILLRK